MKEFIKTLFSTEKAKKLYEMASNAISDYGMNDYIRSGVIVGLSGGADSVALLLVLLRYRLDFYFDIKAIHINHSIRGEEADRDELFSRKLCEHLDVPFEAYKIDVPALAKESGKSIEEAARDARYKEFNRIISTDPGFSTIAVAHNATDNLETVLFNMMRGSGIVGISGIRPIRENVIRPLINAPKELITEALQSIKVDFVTDSTNLSTEYTRNYIRKEIIPKLKRLNDSPEKMCTRFTTLLREDADFLLDIANKFVSEYENKGKINKSQLLSLKKPVLSRVIMLMCKEKSLPSPERTHIDSICSLLQGGDFSLSLPGGMSFVSDNGMVFIADEIKNSGNFFFRLYEGENKLPGFSSIIVLSKDKNCDCFSNIYKKSIQAKVKFDIINDGLYVRSKQDGDAYRYGNMTRKLKKVFNDRNVHASSRGNVPIFCDSNGILWVPGLPVRDQKFGGEEWYITILTPAENDSDEKDFFII